eukprot:537962-Amorphochlora_amoeboformis.AAC.2
MLAERSSYVHAQQVCDDDGDRAPCFYARKIDGCSWSVRRNEGSGGVLKAQWRDSGGLKIDIGQDSYRIWLLFVIPGEKSHNLQARILLGGNDTRAEDYYRSQKPIYNNSTDFELRRSWAQIGFPRTDATWEELISFRVQRMAEFLEKDDIRDFLIEKDKYSFNPIARIQSH